MGISVEDIDKELAARQAGGDSMISEIDAELRRRGVQVDQTDRGPGPSNANLHALGETVSKVLKPFANAQSKIESTMPFVAGLVTPGLGLATDAVQRGTKGLFGAFEKGGENVAESLATKGKTSPEAAAAIGTGIGLIPQVASAFIPGAKFPEMKMLKPAAGAGRAEGVSAAAEMGVPLTRAEITGSKPTSLIESGLEKSLTGSGSIQRFRQTQSAAINNALQSLKKRFGSAEPLSSSGADAKIGMQSELGAAREAGRQLYRDIPDVAISPSTLQKTLDDLVFNNPDKTVLRVAKEVKDRLGTQVPITEETVPKLGSEHSVKPKTPDARPTPTFQQLNDIRNYLSKEIQNETTFNPITGNQVTETGRSLAPLKKALDADIKSYMTNQETPYGKMEAETFGSAFTKANSYHGAVKELINNKLVRKLSKAPESDVAKIVFGPGRPEDILVAKASMGEEGFAAIKKQYFNDLLESKNIGRELDKLEPKFLQMAFRPEELEALKKLDSIKKVSLGAEKIAGNPSGTGQTVGTGLTFAGLGHAAMKAASHPLMAAVEAASILGIPWVTAKAYLGTGAGIPLPVGTAVKGAAASRNNGGDVRELINQLKQKYGEQMSNRK